MRREQGGALGELKVRVPHQRVRDIGIQRIVDGRDEFKAAGAGRLDRRCWLATRERSRNREAVVYAVVGRCAPYAADGGALLEDLDLAERLLCGEISVYAISMPLLLFWGVGGGDLPAELTLQLRDRPVQPL